MPAFGECETGAVPEGAQDAGLTLCFTQRSGTVEGKGGAEAEGSCRTGGSSFTRSSWQQLMVYQLLRQGLVLGEG